MIAAASGSGALPCAAIRWDLDMDIYLTKVASMTSHPPRSDITYGFNIIGVHGRPLVAFAYESQPRTN
jgi:hypothetical protein